MSICSKEMRNCVAFLADEMSLLANPTTFQWFVLSALCAVAFARAHNFNRTCAALSRIALRCPIQFVERAYGFCYHSK